MPQRRQIPRRDALGHVSLRRAARLAQEKIPVCAAAREEIIAKYEYCLLEILGIRDGQTGL